MTHPYLDNAIFWTIWNETRFCEIVQPTSHCDEKNIQLVSLASFVLFLLIFVDFGEFGTILVICDEIFFYTWCLWINSL